MCAKQEVDRRDHAKETEGLENQRQEDAECGEDRHQRGKEQNALNALFHAGAG